MRRRAAALIVLLMLGSTRAAGQRRAPKQSVASNSDSRLAAPVDNGSGQILVEVRIGAFASRAMVVREHAESEVLLPLTRILTLAEIPFRRRADRLESTGRNTSPAFVIDFKSHQMRLGRDRFVFNATELFVDVDGVWIARPLLKRMFNGDIVYDEASADLEVRNAEQLPVGKRMIREAGIRSQRLALQKRINLASDAVVQKEITPSSARKSIVLDYQIAHQRESTPVIRGGGSSQEFSIDVGTAFPLAAGVFNIRSNATRTSARQSAVWSWQGVNNSVVNQVQLGEVQTRALESTTLRGFLLSNSDMSSPFDAGTRSYGVNAPVGWWVDAFRGNTLVSESRTDIAERSLSVPLMYGTNVLEIVARGPLGEHRSYERSFHTPSMYVRPGKLEYSVLGGVCAMRTFCSAALSADLRYSLGNRATLRAGAERIVPRVRPPGATSLAVLPSSASIYTAISSVVARSVVADASFQLGVEGSPSSKANLQVRYEPTPHTMARMDYSSSTAATFSVRDASESPSAQSDHHDTRKQSRVAGYFRHSLAAVDRRVSIEGWGSIQNWNVFSLAQLRAGASMQSNSIHFRPYVRTETRRTEDRRTDSFAHNEGMPFSRQSVANGTVDFAGADFTLVPSRDGAIGAWWLRGNLESHSGRLSSWSAALARSVGNWRVDATVAGGSLPGQRTFTLSVISELPKVQVSSVVTSTSSRNAAVTQSRGAVVYDRSTKQWSLSSEPSTGRSGIAGVVFLDENGDGIRQKSEKSLPDAQLFVNNRSVRTNRDGYFVVWGVPVQIAHQVALDTTSLSDPSFVPAEASLSVRARPGALASTDIAVVRASAVHGTVFLEQTDTGQACQNPRDACDRFTRLSRPVRLVLRSMKTGKSRYFDSFSDGSFYEEGVVPGEYEISVMEESLPRGAKPFSPLKFAVRPANLSVSPTSESEEIRLIIAAAERSSRDF